jgi:hypothetical protein
MLPVNWQPLSHNLTTVKIKYKKRSNEWKRITSTVHQMKHLPRFDSLPISGRILPLIGFKLRERTCKLLRLPISIGREPKISFSFGKISTRLVNKPILLGNTPLSSLTSQYKCFSLDSWQISEGRAPMKMLSLMPN